MKKISTLILIVGVLWYAATSSGNSYAIIVAVAVTVTALPVWAYVVAKKTGQNPVKWLLLSILLPLIAPLALAIIARRDILAATQREKAEGKKGFWEKKFGKFGELIPYGAALLLAFGVFGLTRLPALQGLSSAADMSYDVINGNETANLVNGGLWLRTNSFELFANQQDGGKIYAVNNPPSRNVYKYADDAAANLCELNGYIYYINRSDHDRIYRMDTSKGEAAEKVTDDAAEQFCIADRIYYINKNDNNRIYRVNPDGKEKKKLSQIKASDLFQNYQSLFYINTDDNCIYQMTVDGKNSKKLLGDRAGQMFIWSNRIYYIALNDGNRVYSVTPEGKGRRKECDYGAGCMNCDGSLIFANTEDDGRVYMLNFMSGELMKLSDDTGCTNINVVFGSGVMYLTNGEQKFVNFYNEVLPVEYFPGESGTYGDAQDLLPTPMPVESQAAAAYAEPGNAGLSSPFSQSDAFARDGSGTPFMENQTWPV